ncbi:MAG: SOS response-associated peptidase [Xanthobacteraceae bacterium]|nr:SOS response-associated peptidase [Xanthobacteraceae bacterium]
MCGRFVITSPPAAIRAAFDFREQPNFPARHNIAPTQPVGVVLVESSTRHFRLMRWGFIPSWVKDPRGFPLLINARAETVRDKPAFRNAIRRRRCLLAADGYYEWRTEGGQKHPYFIYPRVGGPIGFAGIAETWSGPNGEEVDTVAIVTAAAKGGLAMLHHRVPVTIPPGDFARWLDCASVNANDVAPLMAAPDDDAFAWHRVSRDVNSVGNDDAWLIQPLSEQQIADEAATPKAKSAPRKPDDDGQKSLF